MIKNKSSSSSLPSWHDEEDFYDKAGLKEEEKKPSKNEQDKGIL